MIRAVIEADAEAIYELLFAARDEIPLSKIETDQKRIGSTASAYGVR